MQEITLNRANNTAQKTILYCLCAYLFILLFPHTNTLKEIAFWGAFISWLIVRNKRESFLPLNQITIPLLAFLLIPLVSSVLSMEPLGSIKDFKGEIFIPVILFLIIATEIKGEAQIKKLLITLVISLSMYTVMTAVESAEKGLSVFWGGDTGAEYPWKMESSLFFPITLGLLLFTKNKIFKNYLIGLAFIELILITLDRQIIVFMGAIPILLLWLLFARPKSYRRWMLVIVSLFMIVFAILLFNLKDNPAMNEYINKTERLMNFSDEFKNAGGLSNRMGLWHAAIDLIKDRPLLGYGSGVEKFFQLTDRDDMLEKWKNEKPDVYELITAEKKLSHNIFLDIGLQSGVLGMLSFLIFLIAYIYSITRVAIRNRSDGNFNFLLVFIGGMIALFMATNLLNSELSRASGKLFFAMLGTGAAWIRDI